MTGETGDDDGADHNGDEDAEGGFEADAICNLSLSGVFIVVVPD